MLRKIFFSDDFDPKDGLFMLGLVLIIGGAITTAAGEPLGIIGVVAGIGVIVLAFWLVKKS